ncbi:MAG TPA: GLUG motif-containing protein [Fibrobacteraceae bacterium]|nr:GLUG motif-containing protein [Fibrobacteraceae bacterium]
MSRWSSVPGLSIKLVPLVMSMCVALYAQTSVQPSGSGTSADPYQIDSLPNLYWLSQTSTAWADTFVQTSDIDASETSGWNSGSGWSPIGNATTRFTGAYHGSGHELSGLSIVRGSQSYVGLFGYISRATLDSIELNDVYSKGYYYVGGLAGYADTLSSISYCHSTGTAWATSYYSGGLVGIVDSSSVTGSHSSCAVLSGSSYAGGLVGDNIGSSLISDSYATGSVQVSEYYAGGLVGRNDDSEIKRCYSIGSVVAYKDGGGFVGMNDNGTLSDCFSSGNVNVITGSSNGVGGGFVGSSLSGAISRCYSSGKITSDALGAVKGGFAAESANTTISACYWDMESSGLDSSALGTGMGTTEMKDSASFAGWDFADVWTIYNGVSYPWLRTVLPGPIAVNDTLESSDFPESFSAMDAAMIATVISNDLNPDEAHTVLTARWLSGSVQNDSCIMIPYEVARIMDMDTLWGFSAYVVFPFKAEIGIATYEDLKKISTDSTRLYPMNGNYVLTADIDASASAEENSGVGFTPIGSFDNPFCGHFHGRGHVIRHLSVYRPDSSFVGLFGYTKGATIDSVGLVSSEITGSQYVGGLIGYSTDGTSLSYSYNASDVSGVSYVGGLTGLNNDSSRIERSYNTGNISATYRAGGLTGYHENSSTISNSYNTGYVIAAAYSGGIVAVNFNGSEIQTVYNGGVATINWGSSSFPFYDPIVPHN